MGRTKDASQWVGRWLGTDDISKALEAALKAPGDRSIAEQLAASIVRVAARSWSDGERFVAQGVLSRVSAMADHYRWVATQHDAQVEQELRGDTERMEVWRQIQTRASQDVWVPATLDPKTSQEAVRRVQLARKIDGEVEPDPSQSEAQRYWGRLSRAWTAAAPGYGEGWRSLGSLWDSFERNGPSEERLREDLQALVPGWAGPSRTELVVSGFSTGLAGVCLGSAFWALDLFHALLVSLYWLVASGRFARKLVRTLRGPRWGWPLLGARPR